MTEKTEIPVESLGSLLKEQALIDCEINVLSAEGLSEQINKWDVLKESSFQEAEYAHEHAHAWFETEVRIQEQTSRATRLQPAGYKNHYVPAHVSIVWDLSTETMPKVDIEIEEP